MPISYSIWCPTPVNELPGSDWMSVLIEQLNLAHAALSFWWQYVSHDQPLLLAEKALYSELGSFDQSYGLLVTKSVQNTIPLSFQKYIELVVTQEKAQ